jgi:hypothetical protein
LFILYNRLDLIQGGLIMLAFFLLVSRLHYAWSFAALAAAINFKLVPLVLAPVWVVGSWPAAECLDLRRPRVWVSLAWRGCLLLGLVGLCFLPFYVSAGDRSLSFFAFHRDRGIEYESLYGSLMLGLQQLGQAVEIYYWYGSVNLRSELSPFLAGLALWLTAGLMFLATALLLAKGHRLTARSEPGGTAQGTLAQTHPQTFVCFTLLFLMLFMAANKVFAPQYLLWVAPLVPLVPFARQGRHLFLALFVSTCLLTSIVFPIMFVDLVEAHPDQVKEMWTFKQPTLQLAVILGIRNLLFLGLTVSLVFYLWSGMESKRTRHTCAGREKQASG